MGKKELFTFRQSIDIFHSIRHAVSEEAFYNSKFTTLESFIADGINNTANLVILQPKKTNRVTPYGGRRANVASGTTRRNKFQDFLDI